jgi:hypothetical protein
MDDLPPDSSSPELIPRAPDQKDLARLCREQGDLFFLNEWFSSQGKSPPNT